jgi:hypothetical protein
VLGVNDTSPPASARYHELLRAMGPERRLDAVGAEYFIGGSVASSFQGEPRATNDIDIVVALPVRRVAAFAEALGSEFEVDQDMVREALGRGGSANISTCRW